MTLFARTIDVFDVLHIYLTHPLGLKKLESRGTPKHFFDVFSTPDTSRVLRHLETKFQRKDSRGEGRGARVGQGRAGEEMGRQGRGELG